MPQCSPTTSGGLEVYQIVLGVFPMPSMGSDPDRSSKNVEKIGLDLIKDGELFLGEMERRTTV